MLVLGRRHLDRLLAAYASHYNAHRPHRGLSLAVPEGLQRDPPRINAENVRRRDLLGGLIHEYTEAA